MEPIIFKWQVNPSNASRYPVDVTPSYSMYKYLEMKPSGNTGSDASFIRLNNAYPSASLSFVRSEDATSYQLLLTYKEGLTAYERYAAIRVPKISPILDPSKVYSVKNADDLLKINWNLAGTYELSQDFDLPPFNWTYLAIPDYSQGGWQPIGSINEPFQGTLDGKGFHIKNLTIQRPSEDYLALFGIMQDATIKNLNIENASITGSNNLGIAAGLLREGQVLDSSFSGKLSGRDYVGGVVGKFDARLNLASLKLSNLTVNIDAFGLNQVGGVAGQLLGSAERLKVAGKVEGISNVGGIFGSVMTAYYPTPNSGIQLIDIQSAAKVYAGEMAGGIVGYMETGDLRRIYVTPQAEVVVNKIVQPNPNLSSGDNIGGVVGKYDYLGDARWVASYAKVESLRGINVGGIVGSMAGSVDQCYIAGNLKGWEKVGAIVGEFRLDAVYTISNCYADAVVVASSNYLNARGGLIGTSTATAPIASSLTVKNNFVTQWSDTRATTIIGNTTNNTYLSDNFFPSSVQTGSALAGTAPLAANDPNYTTLFTNGGFDTANVWQLSTADKWPSLRNLPGPALVPTPIY